MGSVKVTVYGRVKPCPKNSQNKEYRIKEGENEDFITFTTTKPIQTKKTYRFRKIFNELATQDEVFDVVAKPIIESVLSGYNGTIFTYGQTGSGKTYTMTGDIEQWDYPGLIPRTIQKIFQMKEKDVNVSVTYCEIYNEHVYDLIRTDRTDSDVTNVSFVDSTGVTHFRNLSVHNVSTAYEAIQLLLRGDANKMIAETSSNANSSRSHVLFSITLELPHPTQEKYYLKPVLYLVDLAGSEKLSKCKSQTTNPWETRYINLSLHYLEQVLFALRQPGRVHVPYRNSLMTALLRNSLGGNCITAMIATFCLSIDDLDETLQTCRFAERIALIKNDVKLTEAVNPEKELEELRKENMRLRSQIKMLSGHLGATELNNEEKEKCAEVVQAFIESSSTDCLPFSDVRRLEYCFYLMRDEILKKPKREPDALLKRDTPTDFFKKLCPRIDSFDLEQQKNLSFSMFKQEKQWKNKKAIMSLPKVNITYKIKSSEQLTGDKDDDRPKKPKVTVRRPTTTPERVPSAENSEILESQQPPNNHPTSRQPPTTTTRDTLRKGNSGYLCPNDDGGLHSSDEEIEITEEATGCSIESRGGSPSGTTFKIEMTDDEKITGESLGVGKIKKLISIGVQIDKEVRIESEEEIDLQEIQDQLSVISDSDSSRMSWNCLPLTGDPEVDEEIIKFYKARYKIFKAKEC